MPMGPPVVARQEPVEGLERIVVGAGTQLEDHEAGGRVGHEHVEEPVASIGGRVDEALAVGGEIVEAASRPGRDAQLGRVHRRGAYVAARG